MQAKEVLQRNDFWLLLQMACSFLQPFSDFIHQIEADKPALGRAYEGLMALDEHVKKSMKVWNKEERTAGGCAAELRTWECQLDNRHGKMVVLLRCLRIRRRTCLTRCTAAWMMGLPHRQRCP